MKVPVDLTGVGVVPDGTHEGLIQDVQYQVKTGEKWNKDGTTTVTDEEWSKYPMENRRLNLVINTPHGMIFHAIYMVEGGLSFVKQAVVAAGASFGKDGFDPQEMVGKRVRVQTINDDVGTRVKKLLKY